MSTSEHSWLSALAHAWRAALHWRLLLLWTVAMLIPTAVVALPLWAKLGDLLDHSVHSAEWARQFDALAMSDVVHQVHGLNFEALLSLVLTLLLSPLLTGMAVTLIRSQRSPSFAELLRGGAHEFGSMFRLLLWAALPFAAVAVIGALGFALADSIASEAVLQSQADMANLVALVVLLAAFLLAHAMVESGRAQLAVNPALRSARSALLRGAGVLWRRPFATLGIYLSVGAFGYLLVMLLVMLRIRTTAVGWSGIAIATVLTQLITMALAWQRTARLFALTDLARSSVPVARRAQQAS